MEFYNHIYLENSKLITDKLFLFGLFVILVFLVFVLSRWFRGSITLKEKQLSLLALILVPVVRIVKNE